MTRKASREAVEAPRSDDQAGDEPTLDQKFAAAVEALRALERKHTELAEYHLSVAGQVRRLLG